MANYLPSDKIGDWTGLNTIISANTIYDKFILEFIIGFLFAPVAWLPGEPSKDIVLVGQLLSEKAINKEFYAYVTLGELKDSGSFVHYKSMVMATYILCNFANFA